MVKCKNCVYSVDVRNIRFCHFNPPTVLPGPHRWPPVADEDCCGQGLAIPGQITNEPDYLDLNQKPS